jgi:predicted nucleotidyltransferase
MPELSFGTHFFQDLVEAGIFYLPLYPDEGNIFNEAFFTKSENKLPALLPEFKHLEDVVRVISVPETTFGRVMSILMNAELEEAVGVLSSEVAERRPARRKPRYDEQIRDESAWRWRYHMAERMASLLDAAQYGVKAVYMIGSTKNGTAGPSSDIDLLIHFEGAESQKADLKRWLDGWSQALSEVNYLKTGYSVDGILDVHFLTDEDIGSKDSFAIRIESPTDPAYRLKLLGE